MNKAKNNSIKQERARKFSLPIVAGASLPAGAPPARLRTRALWTGAGQHDVVYISSWVHDAIFRLSDVYESGQWLVIPIDRERQELPKEKDEEATRVRSEILLGPLKWWTLEFAGRLFISKEWLHEPSIVIFGLQSSSGEFWAEDLDDQQIVIDCTGARLKVRLTDKGELRLEDLPPKRKRKKLSDVTIRVAWPMGG
jgi:hypothetical protein